VRTGRPKLQCRSAIYYPAAFQDAIKHLCHPNFLQALKRSTTEPAHPECNANCRPSALSKKLHP
jgi:hypothetical protein